MNENELVNLFIETSKRLTQNTDGCDNLIYTPKNKKIREPEATWALTMILSEKNINFGLEVPTNKKYRFSGKNVRSGNIDLVIYGENSQINIEFKDEQPGIEKIRKDFEKLIREDCDGTAFFHILQNTDKGTVPILLDKYYRAYKINEYPKNHLKWFILFIYIKGKKEFCYKIYKDITNLTSTDFDYNIFIKEKCG